MTQDILKDAAVIVLSCAVAAAAAHSASAADRSLFINIVILVSLVGAFLWLLRLLYTHCCWLWNAKKNIQMLQEQQKLIQLRISIQRRGPSPASGRHQPAAATGPGRAARRRLVKRLYIPLPDADARKQIITNFLKNESNELSEEQICEVASLTEGYSGADMRSLCEEASMGPVRCLPPPEIHSIHKDQVRPVNIQDFKDALQRVRPSVSQDDLGVYVEYNNTYGQGF